MSLTNELLGTIPGWITSGGMIVLVWHFLRHRQAMTGLRNVDENNIRDHYAKELTRNTAVVEQLRQELKVARDELNDCEEECRRKIKELEEQLWGEKRQRVSEQIALINLILKNVDAPELQTLKDMLERTQTHMLRVQTLEQRVEELDQ